MSGLKGAVAAASMPQRIVVAVIILLCVVGVILGAVYKLSKEEREENEGFVNTGVVIEREAAKTEVLNNVEKANDARNNPTDAERRAVCSKYDRNCKNDQ